MTTISTRTEATELFRRPPHRHLDVDHGAVGYRCVGQGPDVLFVHGWPVSGATFRTLLPALTPHVTCHLLDLVGAGDSRFDRSATIDLAHHIQSVRRVVDALELDDVAVVGHDSGGLIARHAMAGDPRVRAFALLNTEMPPRLNFMTRQLLLAGKVPGFASLMSWAAMKPLLRPRVLAGCFVDETLLDGEFTELFLAPLRADADRRWAAGQLARRFDATRVETLGAVHARIEAPVQLVWGARDPYFPVSQAREAVDTFPEASLHVVDDARLFVHEERPDEVAEAMLPTLLLG